MQLLLLHLLKQGKSVHGESQLQVAFCRLMQQRLVEYARSIRLNQHSQH